MKQTAVEWLDEQIEYISIQIIDGFLTIKEFMEKREKLFKQAKEMEKQHIGDAFMVGVRNEKYRFDTKEQCYNEIFKNK